MGKETITKGNAVAGGDGVSKPQIRCIKAMVGKLGIADADVLVLGFTEMRTGKVSEMTGNEARLLIGHLKKLDPDERNADTMRKKLIAMAYEREGLGRKCAPEQKKEVIAKLNAWCRKYGYLHKELDGYSYNELPALISQFEKVWEHTVNGI